MIRKETTQREEKVMKVSLKHLKKYTTVSVNLYMVYRLSNGKWPTEC